MNSTRNRRQKKIPSGGGAASITLTSTAIGPHTHAESDVTSLVSDLAAKVATTRTISTTAPLTGGGDLSANRTLAVSNATTSTAGVVELATDGENAASVVVQGNDSRLSNSRTPTSHHTSHESGGGDAIKLDDLAAPDDNTDLNVSTSAHGLTPKAPNDTAKFLRGDATWAVPTTTRAIAFAIDGGGAAISTGVKFDLSVPVACTITGCRLLADQSGSIVIDIWKDTYANYPPTVADTITASAKPTISTATKSDDTTLTGWTTSISAGDTLRFNVDSCTSIQRVTLILKVTVP